jgi:hypothetical protein
MSKANLTGRSVIAVGDLSNEEFACLIDLAAELKDKKRSGIRGELLDRKNVAIITEKASTRTRCAFSLAAADEGAHPEFLGKNDIHLGEKESVADTARVLGRMFDGIMFRGYTQFTKQWELYDGHSVVFDPARMSPLILQKETAEAFSRFYSLWETFKQIWTFDLLKIARRFRGRKLARAQMKWWRRRVADLREEQIHEIDTYPEQRKGLPMIKRNEILIILALMMIVTGGGFFLAGLGVMTFHMRILWPLLPLGLGVGLYGLFFFTWLGERKTQGLLPIATVLVIMSMSFLYSTHVGWNCWRYIWPVAPLSLGLGLYSMYIWGRGEREVLGPAGVLTGVALLAFLGSALQYDIAKLWPVILVLLGVALLIWNFRRRA